MDKLNLKSKDIASANIDKLAELFPSCVIESDDGKTVDMDALRQEFTNVEIPILEGGGGRP